MSAASIRASAAYRARRAAEVARLTSENARFRSALEEVAKETSVNAHIGDPDRRAEAWREVALHKAVVARQALEADGATGQKGEG